MRRRDPSTVLVWKPPPLFPEGFSSLTKMLLLLFQTIFLFWPQQELCCLQMSVPHVIDGHLNWVCGPYVCAVFGVTKVQVFLIALDSITLFILE